MCGIIVLHGEKREVPYKLLGHRGPDTYRSCTLNKCRMDFYRLCINDLTPAGMQPFVKNKSIFVCNGEIYNHRLFKTGNEKSNSDCEVVMDLIMKDGIETTLSKINGDFAFAYSDGDHLIAARDPVGVRPLFYTRYAKDSIAFASEVKALLFLKTKVHIFPPGHFYDSYINDFICYHNGHWNIASNEENIIKERLINAVDERLNNTERDIGFLLSGGLDSSLIASIAQKKIGKIKTFSIGLEGSPDLEAARKVAEYLGTDHTEVKFTVEEGLAVIPDVIRSLESYDTTTVRASVPMWLLCKYIKDNTECRYIFSGEGSDEVLGGYLYFHGAPSTEEFAYENMRRLKLIHQFDGLRADRCAGAHGLDLIVPFLDKKFIDCCMKVDQKLKRSKIEKKILREAFTGYLPEEVLWRQKDGMSDAVGTNWVGTIKKFVETEISDEMFEEIKLKCGNHNTCLTKEEAYYRSLFWSMYGQEHDHLISEIWRPKWTTITDPSARLLIEKSSN